MLISLRPLQRILKCCSRNMQGHFWTRCKKSPDIFVQCQIKEYKMDATCLCARRHVDGLLCFTQFFIHYGVFYAKIIGEAVDLGRQLWYTNGQDIEMERE